MLQISLDNFHISQEDFFLRLLIVLGVGGIIGLQREYDAIRTKEEIFAGVRTFAFISIIGFISAFLSVFLSVVILTLGFLGILTIVGISYWTTSKSKNIGGTTEVVSILTFFLGVMVFFGFIIEAIALTVITLTLLSLKGQFKIFAGQIQQEEIYAFTIFVTLALLVIPFLPNESFGPYSVINPKEIGWIVVLTSGLGFGGYLMMKFFGSDKGILITGVLGGLVSSTAVTWVFSKRSKETPSISLSCSVAILASSSIMVLRVIVWVYIFNPALLEGLLLPLLLMFFAGVAMCLYYYFRQKSNPKVTEAIPLGDPLNLREAIVFGVLYTVILLVVSYANDNFGDKGILISSTIAGLTDIDAITISMSKLAGQSVMIQLAQTAIVLAAISNTLVKIGIVFSTGSKEIKRHSGLGYAAMFAAGLLAIIIIQYY